MRINRAVLERIIDEEIVRRFESHIAEAAPQISSPLDDAPPMPDEDPLGPPVDEEPPMAVDSEDPADQALDDELAGEDPEVPGSVAADMQGKTIESIEQVDESDVVPGARELILSFDGESDKLRVIITPSGNVKYFWKGLHNDIGSTEDVPPEEIEAEEEEAVDDEEELDTDSLDLPTDDGGMEDPEIPEV